MKNKKQNRFYNNWDYLLVIVIFLIWNIQWLTFPERIVSLPEQTLISGLLKDFYQMIITAASLIIPLSVGIISFVFINKEKFSELGILIKHFYHATIIMLLSVGAGIYNMSHIPFLVIRKSCPTQYNDIFTNESVIILSLFQLCTFILGIIKIFRGGVSIYRTVTNES